MTQTSPGSTPELRSGRSTDRGATATGRVYFWPGGSLWIGRGNGRTDLHDHHALQIALPFDRPCLFRSGRDAAWGEFSGAVIPSHHPHQLESEGLAMAQLFVEPETVEGRALGARFVDEIATLPRAEREAMRGLVLDARLRAAGAAEMIGAARRAVSLLAGTGPPGERVDVRVGRAIEHIRSRLQHGVSLAEASAAAVLSPGRFRHLFVQETGTSFRAYVLWLRINLAIECAMAGGSWTEAAHGAGFADSAHLSRTFKRMFGLSPSALVPT